MLAAGAYFPDLLPLRAHNRVWFGPTKHFLVGRYMANRRSINSKYLPQWVYSDDSLDQPFKIQSHFQNEPIGLSNACPRRHTNFRLRAAAPQIVAEQLSGQAEKWVKQALMFSDNLRGS